MDATSIYPRLLRLADKAGVRIRYCEDLRFWSCQEPVQIGPYLVFPDRQWCESHPEQAWRAVACSLVQAGDYKRLTPVGYTLAYLFPQWLALGAVGVVCWPWAASFLLALGPWPSPTRTWLELRVCQMAMAVEVWSGHFLKEPPQEMLGRIAGRRSYWAWPFRQSVANLLAGRLAKVHAKRTRLPHAADVKYALLLDSWLARKPSLLMAQATVVRWPHLLLSGRPSNQTFPKLGRTETMMQNEVGQCEQHEMQQLEALRKATTNLISQIGMLEVQKARALGQISDLEAQAQKLLEQIKTRFGVAPEVPCTILADGKVMTNEPVGSVSVPSDPGSGAAS